VAAPEAPETTQLAEEAPAEETPTEQVEDDGTEELDVDGSIYRLPKELKAKVSEWKAGSLMREDYTRKTQDLADLHRQAQTMAEAISLRQQFDTEVSKDREELSKVTSTLEQYKQIDWQNIEVENYIKLRGQMDTLKERATELNQAINSKAQEFNQKTDEQKKKAVQAGLDYLKKSIPNFGAESVQAAASGAKSAGYTDKELENVYDARFALLSWKAAQFDRLQEGKSAAVASVQKAPPIVKPGVVNQGAGRDQKYKDARQAMKKGGGNDLAAAARVFLMRGGK
jgi:HD-GYP domain-containing protein (c-di-GMP phosphodiesterase class II)